VGVTVLLLHRLVDGSWHYDWLLERESAGARVVTFRVGERIDERRAGGFEAERIGDHRRMYLDYEGEVSRGRGTVERVARGTCEVLEEGEGRLRARVALRALRGVVLGRRVEGGAWRFSVQEERGAESC